MAKSGNVINTTMGSQILKWQMLETFILFTIYFRHTIPSDYRCSVRIHKIAGPNPGPFSRRLEMSLSVQQRMVAWGSNERNWLRISFALSMIHWASDPHSQPPPPPPPPRHTHTDLYLSRRRCSPRFHCTQLFNTTLPSFLYD